MLYNSRCRLLGKPRSTSQERSDHLGTCQTDRHRREIIDEPPQTFDLVPTMEHGGRDACGEQGQGGLLFRVDGLEEGRRDLQVGFLLWKYADI